MSTNLQGAPSSTAITLCLDEGGSKKLLRACQRLGTRTCLHEDYRIGEHRKLATFDPLRHTNFPRVRPC